MRKGRLTSGAAPATVQLMERGESKASKVWTTVQRELAGKSHLELEVERADQAMLAKSARAAGNHEAAELHALHAACIERLMTTA